MPNANEGLIRRLRELMVQRQLNARELASVAGVGPSFIYDILRGKSANPTLHKLGSVAQVLGVNVDYLLQGTQPAAETSYSLSIVPVYTISFESSFSSGMLVHDMSQAPVFLERHWVEEDLNIRSDALHIVSMPDESMTPMFRAGDRLLVDANQTDGRVGGVYLMFEGDTLCVRQLIPSAGSDETTGRVRMGRVVWFSRALTL